MKLNQKSSHASILHSLRLGETDLKLTPLYEIEMNGFLEEAALLKYN